MAVRLMSWMVGLLFVMVASCSNDVDKTGPSAAQRPSPARAGGSEKGAADVPQVPVAAGKFVFGATEKQYEFFLMHSMVNFPGMREGLRKSFVIPPREIDLPRFMIDKFEVTNQQFASFVKATGYQPADPTNYLKHWTGVASFPEWAASFPVVWISQEDGEAYCKWRGGRLPTEEEWEKAARGTDGRMFPWGDEYPTRETTNFGFGTTRAEPIGNRSQDKSPYGAYDMGGNVAEITSSTAKDGQELRVVIRGGSFVGAGRDAMANKRTLVARQAVRSETVGCRCVSRG